MDLFEKLNAKNTPIGMYADNAHGYFTFPKLDGEIANRMTFMGKEKLVWSVNNYLGLANHPEVRKVDAEATAQYGLASPMGARMMSGNTDFHEQLENDLSDFVQREATMLLNYGYQGVLSLIDALVDRHDVIVYDADSHACIVDGVRLHQGKRFTFRHNNLESLEKQLQRAEKNINPELGGILVITEGVFGMTGSEGKLKEIAALKSKYNFRLLVDDAHGFGTMGPEGNGTGVHQNVQQDVDVYFSTFAKSMASIGAFVSADKALIDFLRYKIRSQIFAKSLPLPLVIGAIKRLELIRNQPELKANLWSIVDQLQNGLKEKGFDIGNTTTPVTPVYLKGTVPEACNLAMDLRENFDIFCSVVIYPVVPKGVIIIRLIPTAVHTTADVQHTLKAFEHVAKKLNEKAYESEKMLSSAVS